MGYPQREQEVLTVLETEGRYGREVGEEARRRILRCQSRWLSLYDKGQPTKDGIKDDVVIFQTLFELLLGFDDRDMHVLHLLEKTIVNVL